MSLKESISDDYAKDFEALDREGELIVLNDKFTAFVKKYFGCVTQKDVEVRNKNLTELLKKDDIAATVNFEIKK